MTALAWIDGQITPLAEATLPVTAEGLLRGDGAFETIGVWQGQPFRLDAHLERLAASLAALALPPTDLAALRAAVAQLLNNWEDTTTRDGMLRISVLAGGTQLVTLTAQPDRPDLAVLSSQPAPWIRPLGTFGPAGAKTLSYAPNMAALRAAQTVGADDALLISTEGWILEGTTFAVLWVRDGVLRTPTLDLGIIASISRAALLESAHAEGLTVEEGRWPLEELALASEVLVSSSVRPCTSIQRVDDWQFTAPGPVSELLSPLLRQARYQG